MRRAQYQGAVPLNHFEPFEITHAQKDLVAGHIGQDGCLQLLSYQPTKINIIQLGGPGLDITIGGRADAPAARCKSRLFAKSNGRDTSVAPVSIMKLTGYPLIRQGPT